MGDGVRPYHRPVVIAMSFFYPTVHFIGYAWYYGQRYSFLLGCLDEQACIFPRHVQFPGRLVVFATGHSFEPDRQHGAGVDGAVELDLVLARCGVGDRFDDVAERPTLRAPPSRGDRA